MRENGLDPEENDAIDHPPSDTSSAAARDARRSVDAPYRDRHDALVWRRRALAREHDEAARAVAQRDRLARQLAVIDDTLRAEARPLLESLEIAKPCKARWEEMQGDDTVRHCARCDRDVYDVARMTRSEAEALFARAGETPCVRLRRRADGRVVTSDCPVEPPSLLARLVVTGVGGAIAGGAVSVLVAAAMIPRITTGRVALRPAPVVVAAAPPSRPPVRIDALTSHPAPPPADHVDVEMGDPMMPADFDRPARLEDAVRMLGPSTYAVDRDLFERAATSAPVRPRQFSPYLRDGRTVGVRLLGVRRSSQLGVLGFQNGDVVLDVNGMPLAHPDEALQAYARLRERDLYVVRFLRRGEERAHVYHVRPFSD